jgi:hypothetical protein
MTNLLLVSISFLGTVVMTPTYASDTCPEPAWNGTGKVERVEVSQNNKLRIKFDWNANTMDICNLTGSTTGAFPASDTVCKSWMSLAMTAQASGKNLILKHNQPNCYAWTGSIDIFTSLYIQQ